MELVAETYEVGSELGRKAGEYMQGGKPSEYLQGKNRGLVRHGHA